MTEINYVIEGGRERCAVRSPSGWLCQLPDGHRELHTINYSEAPDPVMYRRANGHDYKQASQPAEPERPVERAGWPDQAAQAENETDQPALLDLVRQYGTMCASYGSAVGLGHEGNRVPVDALFDRIAALVPQRPTISAPDADFREWSERQLMDALGVDQLPDVIPAIERLKSEVERLLDDDTLTDLARALRERDEARAEVVRLMTKVLVVQADRDDYAARLKAADGSWARVAAERDELKAALVEMKPAADPSVLSVPQIPEGAHLVGNSGTRYQRDGKTEWWRYEQNGDGIFVRTLGTILDTDAPVTVVKREPRTWPKLDDAGSDVRKVEVHGQGIWTRMPRTPNAWTQGIQVRTLGQLRELGEVIEVFDDDPGGAA